MYMERDYSLVPNKTGLLNKRDVPGKCVTFLIREGVSVLGKLKVYHYEFNKTKKKVLSLT